MKFLLTSAGITNPTIAQALFELVGKKPEEISLVFIPTASNIEEGDKTWLIEDLIHLKKLGLKSLDIVDISALDQSVWFPRFSNADILYFEGGNTYHLMEWINRSGLIHLLPKLLEHKVWVGSSAGSMVTNPDLSLKISQLIYEEDFDKSVEVSGLNFVNFYILPHLNSEYFTKVREKNIREVAQDIQKKMYVLDDMSAVVISEGKVNVVSEGTWFEIN